MIDSSDSRGRGLVLAIACCFASATPAEEIAPPRKPPAPAIAARRPMLDAARSALERGDANAAHGPLLDALWIDPFAGDVFDLALAAPAIDADERALLAILYAGARADAKGAFSPSKAAASLQAPFFATLQKLELARAAAVAEVLALAKKNGKSSREIGAPIVARYLREVYFDLARGAPATADVAKPILDEACSMRADAHTPFVEALSKLMKDAFGNRKLDVALLAARSLHGLAVQAALKDLKGPKAPDLSRKRQEAADILGKIRALFAEANTPLTVDELAQMIEDDRIRFTHEHATLSNPGVAVSPTAMYRVETTCGHGTLLGAAETVEYHHRRLANWYGQDPFTSRPGILRVVPEASDLEVEGAPFWWVGGFQSGDVTVLRFNASDIGSLGAGITHELTHRFDGAVYGGLPSWLAEGRAVWTADSYASIEDEAFVPNKANFGTLEDAMRKGYGDSQKLEKLISGTIEDYRDNYVAGYALYVYLATWEEPEGHRVFEPKLREFMTSIGGSRKKPFDAFEALFCDGRDGRPKEFKEFANRFGTFLNGFYWLLEPKPKFRERYTPSLEWKGKPLINDAPTWQFSRNRAEPWFGQEQAAQAGELLAKYGFPTEAAHALAFGQLVDEFRPDRALLLANLLEAKGEALATSVLRNRAHLRNPDQIPRKASAVIASLLPKSKSYVDQLHAAADSIAANTPRAANALRADAIRLADWLGVAPQREAPPALAATVAPFAGLPHDVGLYGYVEDDLTGYEEHRVPNLWYVTDEGDVHVGREKPRDATGTLDRSAGLHHAFTRGCEWLTPGRYRIHGRVQFTTTFVNGAIVFGDTRRDRNLRFAFDAGDYMFSIGQKEAAAKMDSVGVELSASRDGESEGTFPGRLPRSRVKFDSPKDGFDFEILIDGPLAIGFVDGKSIGSYSTTDGQPIEGNIGFAVSMGAYKVSRPTLDVEHRIHDLEVADPRCLGLSLSADGPVLSRDLLQRHAKGVPISPFGSIAVWIPEPDPDDYPDGKVDPALAVAETTRAIRNVAEMLWKFDFDPPFVAILPRSLGQSQGADGKPNAERAAIEASLEAAPDVRATILVHDKKDPLVNVDRNEVPPGLPQLMFIDETGVLRAMFPYYPSSPGMDGELLRWLKLQKARSAPPPEPPPEPDEGG